MIVVLMAAAILGVAVSVGITVMSGQQYAELPHGTSHNRLYLGMGWLMLNIIGSVVIFVSSGIAIGLAVG